MNNYVYIFHPWHNLGLYRMTLAEYAERIEEVKRDKPLDEQDLRLHYLGMAFILPDQAQAEWDKAWAEWDKARAELVKAQAEWDKARAELDKARVAWHKAQAKWHKTLAELDKLWAECVDERAMHQALCWPWCPGEHIFSKGYDLAALVEAEHP